MLAGIEVTIVVGAGWVGTSTMGEVGTAGGGMTVPMTVPDGGTTVPETV